ncbi:uncharacterized protein LOC134530031 [Bacillus rossius redtenbacheri]|uniref:uncharacterized protein LOC134530031 n=1 Tax=Bacillus rossius redtenbacheri TaxID=93214 RepID=UPI002FDEBAA5
MWFVQVENQFALAGVKSDETKFNYVAGNLDCKYATEVRDILVQPPTEDKYGRLKSELIKRLSASQERKTKQLLEHEEVGDRRPSQFLRHLRSLAGTVVPDDLLKSLWLGRLPPPTQAILATQTNSSLDSLAELADAIADTNPRPQMAEAASLESMFDKMSILMTAKIGEMATTLRQEIAAVASPTRLGQHNSRRDRSPSTPRQQRSRSRSLQGICWYHRCFGDGARKCVQPCEYSSGNMLGTH